MRVPLRSSYTWVATLVAWTALATLLIALTAGLAQAQTAVYYSVGTNAADLKIAANVTIAAATATFTVPQRDNVGVGDQLTYNGATVAYISGRTSSTVYTVTTATGAAPTPGGPWVVNSVLRAFNSLADATRNSDDGTHLGGNDLPVLDIQLNLPCYDDGPDPSARVQVRESGSEAWTTDATRYIRIYTPTTTSEAPGFDPDPMDHVRGDAVSLRKEDATLGDILRELSEQAELSFVIYAESEGKLTTSFLNTVHHQYPSAPEIKNLRTVHASANERISRLRSRS